MARGSISPPVSVQKNSNVARIDLVPQRPRFLDDQFRDLFISPVNTPANPNSPNTTRPVTEKTTAADTLFKTKAKPAESVKLVWEGIRNRLSLLPIGADVNNALISRDGNTLVVVANVAGQSNLYTYSLDELSREPAVLKQLTSTPGLKAMCSYQEMEKKCGTWKMAGYKLYRLIQKCPDL